METERSYSRLIALNVGLVAVLGAVTLSQGSASAQPGDRPRGDYTMVSGQILGNVADAIYIVDSNNQEVMALSWDSSRKSMKFIGLQSFKPAAPDNERAPRAPR